MIWQQTDSEKHVGCTTSVAAHNLAALVSEHSSDAWSAATSREEDFGASRQLQMCPLWFVYL